MGFGLVHDKELNIDKAKGIIDSILNVGDFAFIVVDKSTFEVIYENNLANALIGDRIGKSCYDFFYTSGHLCEDCPLAEVSSEGTIITKYSELLNSDIKLRLTRINWFDSREAVFMTLLAVDDNNDYVVTATRGSGYRLAEDKKQTDSMTGIANRNRFYMNAENVILIRIMQ